MTAKAFALDTQKLASDRDVRFSIGAVEMSIPAGASHDSLLEDAGLFANTARELATTLAMDASSENRVSVSGVFPIIYLLQIAEAMLESAQRVEVRHG
jgi:hypothetical protein